MNRLTKTICGLNKNQKLRILVTTMVINTVHKTTSVPVVEEIPIWIFHMTLEPVCVETEMVWYRSFKGFTDLADYPGGRHVLLRKTRYRND